MTEPITLDPAKTALLIMDMQNGIVGRYADPAQIIGRLQAAKAAAAKAGVTVAYVRLGFTDEDYAAIPARNKAFSQIGADRNFTNDSPASQIVERLAPGDSDIVVRKTRYGAFSTTDLAGQLEQRGIDTLVLSGIATSGIVLSTVRDAADRDYKLYVLSDGCADRDPQVHEVLLEKVFPRQADVIDVDRFVSALTE